MKIHPKNLLNYLIYRASFLLLPGLLFSCSQTESTQNTLPILGERETVEQVINGKTVTDTIYHQIPDFSFINQDSQQVTSQTLAGKIYVTDFFFTTCPTICPKMKSQLLRVYEKFKNNDQVVLLSHTIDPQHDSVAVLRDYAERLGVSSNKWHFVTGAKDSVYAIAAKYMVTAGEDENEAGGFVHSGAFILVDTNRHVRGIYDGTIAEQVDKLIQDIPLLLAEKSQHAKN
ncbi:SCO family protein [Adhaeribacter radiodurans]|uniref:SCO family protein n=1 Tax=Adhaeribacter radiodurans TaxID=2745197 RepID=A0A7L7L8J3_9BACT|nr:SCO family protein [Adhaeribacter radiodurans]QMU29118.1 SCO family protein [Adhaeribacter radiodurans]